MSANVLSHFETFATFEWRNALQKIEWPCFHFNSRPMQMSALKPEGNRRLFGKDDHQKASSVTVKIQIQIQS